MESMIHIPSAHFTLHVYVHKTEYSCGSKNSDGSNSFTPLKDGRLLLEAMLATVWWQESMLEGSIAEILIPWHFGQVVEGDVFFCKVAEDEEDLSRAVKAVDKGAATVVVQSDQEIVLCCEDKPLICTENIVEAEAKLAVVFYGMLESVLEEQKWALCFAIFRYLAYYKSRMSDVENQYIWDKTQNLVHLKGT